MKTMKNRSIIIPLIIFSFGLFFACSKDKEAEDISPEEKEAIMEVALQYLMMDSRIYGEAFNLGEINMASRPSLPSGLSTLNPGGNNTYEQNNCPFINVLSENETEMKLVVDYGTGCDGLDGTFRSGKIEITYTYNRQTPSLQMELAYTDFHLGEYTINGKYALTLEGESKQLYRGNYSISKEGFAPSHFEITARTERTNTGFSHTAGASATTTLNNKDYKWKYQYEEPGILNFDCENQFVSGRVKFSLANGRNIGSIDFGDGECDGVFTVTVNGKSAVVEFH